MIIAHSGDCNCTFVGDFDECKNESFSFFVHEKLSIKHNGEKIPRNHENEKLSLEYPKHRRSYPFLE